MNFDLHDESHGIDGKRFENKKKNSKNTEKTNLRMILNSNYLLDLRSVDMGMLVLTIATTLTLE